MNNIQQILYMRVLLEEHEDRNRMCIIKRNLRDTLNPFEMSNVQFKQMFQLYKETVVNLITELEAHHNLESGRIPLHLKVLTTLNFVATGSFQNSVGNNSWVSLSQSSVSRVVHEICTLVTDNLLQVWVKFPTGLEDKNSTKQGFYDKWGARGVLGVVDGTHVEILAPPSTEEEHPLFVYINRKGRHSINVMLISDSKIMGCNARYPGSVHDAAIWQMSNIKRYMHHQYDNNDQLSHLLGDSGYPLEPWLFTPFATVQDGTPEALYNQQHKTVRNVIERTNGILKGRFRCLSRHRVLLYHPLRAARIIYSCCVFHNMALQANLPILEEDIEYREYDEERNANIDAGIGNDLLQLGRAAKNDYIRNNI